MLTKKGSVKSIILIVSFAVIIAIILLVVVVLYALSFNSENTSPVKTSVPQSASSVPSSPSRCSLVAQNDSYVKPDFNRLNSVMSAHQIVKDVPKNGKISLRFFHFTQDCRIWDQNYVISDGKITKGEGSDADIFVTLDSSYVHKITESNFCEVVKEARANDGLGQWISDDVSEAALLWRYKGMLKYRECLGLQITS